jgi:hypothetical protein
MVHSTKLQTIGGKETPGDVLTDELRADIWKNLCSALDQAGVGPIVMWGEWAMLYYGVPINENVGSLLASSWMLSLITR